MKALKQKLKICGCDPFAEVNVSDIATGEKLPKDMIDNLLNADSTGNEKYRNCHKTTGQRNKEVF